MLIVADTSPINYLVLIESVHVLPSLYGRIVIPPEVLTELRNATGSEAVRTWSASTPPWLEVKAASNIDASLPLDPGERAAIALAQELAADRLLIDERDGRAVATRLGIPIAGTLAVLRDAAMAGLIDLRPVFDRLKQTTFRASPKLFADLLAEFDKSKGRP
jgi:predicted nucleic acid-binding protein